jgi:hypothetical protein
LHRILNNRQVEAKNGAAIRVVRRRNPAPVIFHDGLASRRPQPQSILLCGSKRSLDLQVGRPQTGALVNDGKDVTSDMASP